MDAATLTESQQKVLDKYREDLLSGRTLVLCANSHRSRYGYMPPMNRTGWAQIMGVLAEMAARSDRLAQVATSIVGRVNLYGTNADACAKVYEQAFHAMKDKYDDVIGRAGPEAGRYSDHQHAWTLYDRVAVHYWLELATRGLRGDAGGVGWCLALVAKEVGFHPTQAMETR